MSLPNGYGYYLTTSPEDLDNEATALFRSWLIRRFAPQGGARVAETGQAIAGERDRLRDAISQGKRVALFLDYDGTLREIVGDPAAAGPHEELRALFDAMRKRDNVAVTIISGRTKEDLEKWLGEYPFGLIAEHGAWLRVPGGSSWEELDADVDYSWKGGLLKLLRLYEANTPGSVVEEKGTSLVWHYRHTDKEFGGWKANQLAEELGVVAANSAVEIRHGKKIVEISPVQVNKGVAVSRMLRTGTQDLVLCAGDDLTDESMFAPDGGNLLTVKIGDGPTKARCRVGSPAEFRRLLSEALGSGGNQGRGTAR